MNLGKSSLVKVDGKNYLIPFILVTSLFFLWGFAHSLLDVLNKHFQDILGITKARSGWIQAALYGGYFLMGIPAGLFMKRFGYRKGIILGLLLYAFGAFLFFPATYVQTFEFTLLCLFVIACGLTCLETAANPYTTVLGPKESAAQRINLSQSFNGLGWMIGPTIGGLLILGNTTSGDGNKFSSMALPYMIVGSFVLLVALLFFFTKLPEINEEEVEHRDAGEVVKPFWKHRHFRYAVIAQFFYVAAQTGINSFFINYVTETMPNFTSEKAAYLLSLGFLFFWFGRISGSVVMKWIKPNRMIAVYALVNIVAMALVVANLGWISIMALFLTYFCMSIMFPTIFALGIKGLGSQTKQASSYLVMAIVGGAICPVLMGYIADKSSMQIGFLVPLACFIIIFFFGFRGYRMRHPSTLQAG
jgi:FHS family L-fucose permease-like MFS transporter